MTAWNPTWDYGADDARADEADSINASRAADEFFAADSSVANPAGVTGVGGSLPLPVAPVGKVLSLSDLATPELDAALLRAMDAPGISRDDFCQLANVRYLLLLARVKGRK